MNVLNQLEKQLIVSCQALEEEPLHSSKIMGKMAIAALEGGAKGIRANSVADILEIKSLVDLPVIGIIKQEYADSNVYITPTRKEAEALLAAGVDIIAMDATNRKRPKNEKLADIIQLVKSQSANVTLMADISTVAEAIQAEKLGFDCISTTLVGYTEATQGANIADDNFALLKQMIRSVSIPVIAEGKVDTPLKAVKALENGAHFVVVGSAITRPQIITKTFTDALKKG
ncbi:MAG: N-acetylmannosamine-6-phosphate 2-epimerase [Bacillota bacterium]|uniref:Putative N-acetylmannosamine-6-phosphate 2-epimerase n=1 Tax=Virgibacillus salarius TaxID=447199 RepID=A0A941IAN2_9BACI|nr:MULTISPECIES: N-acetylmannosamine-6-phosphate 2-epimerase [Bacillaceae]NAZ09573.1 putative N-acetylmannosamine-6-phosphate 2-epimerase [Agaribacter marinus]MBR7796863.1 N-acetylmannosamine-6-phosphate 2-epimerase [Virgibacillus salarius]MCC2249986.1 N-acetylmannosamine-6-phosphate 2-epimerase [Virgibacillus sp. AGTR]MDY7044676.1 N-acetylmannosamine-6-phosphate 2-epimerase [Virgibacillus sp. M23]QRZ18159.1 N-acetylmannosamine-6-phosphate 2-epimerase [Virgibacillus sp. AGTR]